jgi:hypothetical protein
MTFDTQDDPWMVLAIGLVELWLPVWLVPVHGPLVARVHLAEHPLEIQRHPQPHIANFSHGEGKCQAVSEAIQEVVL